MGKVDNERRVEWLVRAQAPLTLTARSEMAGTAHDTVELGEATEFEAGFRSGDRWHRAG